MKLANLMKKRFPGSATATPAIGATDGARDRTLVAGIAIVAVANPVEPSPNTMPAHIAEMVERVCVWRIEEAGKATRFIVAGPDDDLSHNHRGAIATPLFGDAHRERVRLLGSQGDLTGEPT